MQPWHGTHRILSTDVTGYMIHYGTASGIYSMGIDVGSATSYTVSNLIDGQTYYFAITAYNAAGVESEHSGEVSMLVAAADTNAGMGGSGDGVGCFIATAAFGSYLEPHVKVLRDFQGQVLVNQFPGSGFC